MEHEPPDDITAVYRLLTDPTNAAFRATAVICHGSLILKVRPALYGYVDPTKTYRITANSIEEL